MNVQVLTWNLENFFHPETGGPRFDQTPQEGWTLDKYERKVARLADALTDFLALNAADGAPFVVGLTEVESARVVTDLVARLPERVAVALDPAFTHYLDCVVLFDARHFEMVSCRHGQMFERYERGDVVEVTLKARASGSLLTVFCLHTKARPPERDFTEMYRQALCDEVQTIIWNLHGGRDVREIVKRIKDDETPKPSSLPLTCNAIVMGDFNDEPYSSSLVDYLCATRDRHFVRNQRDINRVHLYNCSWEFMQSEKPGSYFFERSKGTPWSMLDQIVVSPALLNPDNPVRYREGSFRVEQQRTADEKGRPFRMATWDEEDNLVWLEGYSDHFPVRIDLEMDV